METKHTKGEWSVDGFNTTSVITNINGYTKIADCNLAGLTGNAALTFFEENKANAKLIAAAPDLLEALDDMIQYFFFERKLDDGEYIEMEQKAINAIKKATL